MAAESPPYVVQGGSHGATLFRQAISTLIGNVGGVATPADLKVSALGSPSMAINIAGGSPGGQAWVKGTTSNGPQACYYCYNNATQELPIIASGAKPRIDVPIAQVKDAQYAGAENTFSLSVVKGTEATSPVEPAIPASSENLAAIAVAAAASKIENGNITDKRVIISVPVAVTVYDFAITASKLAAEAVTAAKLAAEAVTGAKLHKGSAGDAVSGSSITGYEAQTERAAKTNFTPSATRPVFVVLEGVESGVTSVAMGVTVGGVKIAAVSSELAAKNPKVFASFICPAGVAWQAEGPTKIFSSYIPL